MKRGPSPTPTALKLTRENPSRRPINDSEPRPQQHLELLGDQRLGARALRQPQSEIVVAKLRRRRSDRGQLGIAE